MPESPFFLTAGQRAQWPAWHARWIDIARRTQPQTQADRRAASDAVNGLYDAACLERPRNIVFVPSPLVGWVTSGMAAAIWFMNERSGATATTSDLGRDAEIATSSDVATATSNATWQATWDAVWRATFIAPEAFPSGGLHWDATWHQPWDGVWQATFDAVRNTRSDDINATIDAATGSAIDEAIRGTDVAASRLDGGAGHSPWISSLAARYSQFDGAFMTRCVRDADAMMAGGNLWPAPVEFIGFFRHVIALPIDFTAWRHYEAAAIHGGFRFMHPKFCVVVDFPELAMFDAEGYPHGGHGPSHRWRDGFEVRHRHGRYVPSEARGEIAGKADRNFRDGRGEDGGRDPA